MIPVDTNILAYLLIEGDRNSKAQTLLSLDSEWHSEPYIFKELTNVLVTTLRANSLSLTQCRDIRDKAEVLLGSHLHDTLDGDALAIAVEFKITAYDAYFLGVARTLGIPLVTEDRKLRMAAPNLTQSLDEAIASLQ